MNTRKSHCGICTAACGIEVDIENGSITAVRGDRDHPMSRGYTCTKGRNIPFQINSPSRLTQAMKRDGNGNFQALDGDIALDEIAARLRQIIAAHGPQAVASYSGTGIQMSASAMDVIRAWHRGIGSDMNFSSLTIDQPAKLVAIGKHGVWGGGAHAFASADVAMLIGANPIVSALNMVGAPAGWRPMELREAKKRGLKLIVVDPRRTEVAAQADLHLAIRPGEDAALLAGMIHILLAEERYDKDFCDRHADGLEDLRQSVRPYTPGYTAARTGLNAADIRQAAHMFAEGPRGVATSGTGPDMAPWPNLTEHLILAINTLCGRWNQAGEKLPAPGILLPNVPMPAQALPMEFLPPIINLAANSRRSRIRGARQLALEMPTPVLADEILTPGEGQIRALIVIGGNPVASWPDQEKTLRALTALELLVCIDLRPNASARHAHYLLPATHPQERDEISVFNDRIYDKPFAQYSKALVPPRGACRDDWRWFAGLAHCLGTAIPLPGGALDCANPPSTLEVLELIRPTGTTKVPIRTLAEYEGGHVFEEFADLRVAAPFPGVEARLHLCPDSVGDELQRHFEADIPQEGCYGDDGSYSHLLVCRRVKHVSNSMCHDFPGNPLGNPAYVHPDDLADAGLRPGDLAELASEHGVIRVVLAAEPGLRRGVVSMAHCFGGDPLEDEDVRRVGSPVSRLIPTDKHYDPETGMARQSAVPVRINPIH